MEREKINKIVKKLEIDLINAKIDLLEDDTIKKNLFGSTYLNNEKIIKNNSDKENNYDSMSNVIRTYDYNHYVNESKTANKTNESKGINIRIIIIFKLP